VPQINVDPTLVPARRAGRHGPINLVQVVTQFSLA
jgi:hypothetical protein